METFKDATILLLCVLKLMEINKWKMYWNFWKSISNKEKKEKIVQFHFMQLYDRYIYYILRKYFDHIFENDFTSCPNLMKQEQIYH